MDTPLDRGWWTLSSYSLSALLKSAAPSSPPSTLMLGIIFLFFLSLVFSFSFSFLFFFPSECHLCTPHLSHVSQWVPFFSSSAILHSAFIFWRGGSTQYWCSGFYIWWHDFYSCHPEKDLWSTGQGGLHSWVPRDCNNYRDSSWKTTISRASHRQQTEHTPTLFVKEAICLSRNFSPGDKQQVWHTPRGWAGALKDAARNTIFALPPVWLQFTSNSQEGAYKPTGHPIFGTAARHHPQIAWLWGPAGLIFAVL